MPAPRVRFLPEDNGAVLAEGKTLLDAAQTAGLEVSAVCGGQGTCGKCRMVIREGSTAAPPTEHLTPDEVREGYVLACQAIPQTDVVVEIPPETQLTGYLGLTEDRPRIDDCDELPTMPVAAADLDPLARTHHLGLPAPTLDDPRADAERLLGTLAKVDSRPIELDGEILQELPRVLRRLEQKRSSWTWEWDGRVTAVLSSRGEADEVLSLDPGHGSAGGCALAVDVGTTTIVAHLVDLRSGRPSAAAAKYNSQIPFGADVISRIEHARRPGGSELLQQAVVADLNVLAADLAERGGISPDEIPCLVVAGNTTMLHLLLGWEVDLIRRAPFVPVVGSPPPLRTAEIGLRLHPRALLYAMPMVGSFVGGDITAGVLASGLHLSEEIALLIDIGTNGEIVLGNRDFAVACAASAGPAFEGGAVTCGMRAAAGAIDRVHVDPREAQITFSTIGRKPAVGLCGSGLVDALAELRRAAWLDRSGRFQPDRIGKRFRTRNDGTGECLLARAEESGGPRDVVLTQGDVENLLRTKGAIYAAADSLVQMVGLSFGDVERVYIAGAFGNHLDLERAIAVGLLPDVPRERLHFIGNSALAGARLALLSRRRFAEAGAIRERMAYRELMVDPAYLERFTAACFLPHTDLARFPSVAGGNGGPPSLGEGLIQTFSGARE